MSPRKRSASPRRASAPALVIAASLCAVGARADAQTDFHHEDPAVAEAAGPVPRKAREVPGLGAKGLPVVRRVRPGRSPRYTTVGYGLGGGALAGKTVYLSAGHGWVWRSNLNGWRTQRPNTHNLVEDMISTETISHYLIRYLENMGAYVVTVREADFNSDLALVDDAADAAGEGFSVEGSIALADGPSGYGALSTPISDQSNPFTAGGSRTFAAVEAATGAAVWTFDVPADGTYNVYVGWVQDASRASDAHYSVRHTGGETHFRVDQRRHGSTWVRLGRFYFEAGRSPARGAVALHDDSADAGATLSADVARIGGGVGVIDRGGGANGKPMFENCSRYYAQLAGAPTTVYDYSSEDGNDDVGTRSRFSAWEHEDGEDAVYIAWHTNAPDPGRGTSSFAYGPDSYGDLSQFTGVPGSLELMDAVHNELIADFRAAWEEDWRDRGQHTAYFGEVNPNHNPEMPAALFEIAFHDTLADADSLRDPRFRALAARAMAQGVAKYFAAADGATLVLPPGPPTAPRMTQEDPGESDRGTGMLRISFGEPATDAAGGDAPTGYRVYLSRDGRGFDEGVAVTETSLLVEAPEDGGALYARITATNDGGESFPSRVVGGREAPSGRAQVLVVAGFDRIDRHMLSEEDLSAFDIGTVERALIERINDTSHAARAGAAIDAARVSFDTVAADAVLLGAVDLADYSAVVWMLGEESLDNLPLAEIERTAIADYLAGGGRLFLSGSELAWVLAEHGGPEEQAFLLETLHAVYVADDADTYAVTGTGGPFDGLGELSFADRGAGGYDVDFPDVLEPASGGAAVLAYQGGAGGTAATWWDSEQTGERLLVTGFPFETIEGKAQRAEFMARVLQSFEIEADPAIPDDPDDPDDPDPNDDLLGCGCRSGSGGGDGSALLGLLLLVALFGRHATRR